MTRAEALDISFHFSTQKAVSDMTMTTKAVRSMQTEGVALGSAKRRETVLFLFSFSTSSLWVARNSSAPLSPSRNEPYSARHAFPAHSSSSSLELVCHPLRGNCPLRGNG